MSKRNRGRKKRPPNLQVERRWSNRIEWPEKYVGRRYGISKNAVSAKRRTLGIPGYDAGAQIMPTPALLKLLREPGIVVTQRTGISWDAIYRLRRKHGIKAQTYDEKRWSPAVVARLGKVPDKVIAQELGIHPNNVGKKRRSLGIPVRQPASRWLPHELAMLGTLPDEVVARKLGRSVVAVRTKRFRLARQARRGKPKADAEKGSRRRQPPHSRPEFLEGQ